MSIKMQMNCLFLLIGLFYYSSIFAEVYPNGCRVTDDFGWSGEEILLNATGNQAFYLIRNKSNFKIELQRNEIREVFMSPPLVASIRPAYTAALAADVANVRFKCYKHNAGQTELVKCSDVLDICQYPFVKFAVSNMGTYWVSTDKPQTTVINDAVAKGIYLRWK